MAHSAKQRFFRFSLSISALLLALASLNSVKATRPLAGQNNTPVTTVSAASFAAPVAPDSIAAAFGVSLATRVEIANSQPLPTSLAGTTVRINGQPAPLFFVSPGQIDFLIPPDTPAGTASVVVTSGDGTTSNGTVQIATVAPALFTANASGSGVPAASLLRVAANGAQSPEPIAQFDAATGTFRPRPINLGPAGDRVFLILFPAGIRRAAANTVRVLMGGQSVDPAYAGPAPGFSGLDQINVEIPRSLNGSGLIKLSVSASGSMSSNEVEVEIAAPSGINPPQVTGLSATTLSAGQELTLTGTNFSATAAENSVRIIGDETQPEAQILEASPTRLRVLVPFGASSGKISVRTPQGEGSTATLVAIRTSVSGFVQDNQRQPIRGVTMRMSGTNISAQTNAEGAFLLPDVSPSVAATVEIDGTTAPGALPYPKQQFKMRVRADHDNQVNGYLELKQATGPSLPIGPGFTAGQPLVTYAEWPAAANTPAGQIQTGQIILDVPNNATVRFPGGTTSGSLTLTALESGRTPGTLPSGQFSPVIAQITPFGATISPGAKITFPNPDGYGPNTQLKLFRYDQRATVNGQSNPTLGTFIEAGTATVSADGQRIESAPNAVTETSYYFASGTRPTITLIGRVVENNLNRTPVRRSLVNARGQGVFTDGNGGFVIRNVPINASSAFAAQLSGEIVVEVGVGEVAVGDDRVGVEADFMRPSTRVDRSQQEQVPPVANAPVISPDLILSSNHPPTIIAPSSTTANAGIPKDVGFFASDSDAGQTVTVTVEGASFATVIKGSGDNFTLRLTPGANDGGNYNLTLAATDGRGGASTQAVKLRVNGPSPIANEQVVQVGRNTPKAIMLTGSDPQNRSLIFTITSLPTHGLLSGTAPNISYTPTQNYTGPDSFSFKVRAGQAESDEAAVTISVQQQNSAPTLIVPSDQTVNGGEVIKFTVSASDPDTGQTMSFSPPELPPGAFVTQTGPTSLEFTWAPVFTQTGDYTAKFTVADNGAPPLSAVKEVKIKVDAKWAKTSGPEDAHITALLVQGGVIFASTDFGGVFRSANGGQDWGEVNTGLKNLSVNALSTNGSVLLAGTFQGIFRSLNGGQSWSEVSSVRAVPINAFALVGTAIYAGGSGGVYRSTDQGQNWVSAGNGLPKFSSVQALAAAGTTLYAGLDNGDVYRSTDQGQNWMSVNEGLTAGGLGYSPAVVGNRIAVVGNRILAVAYDGRIFRLNEDGQHWSEVANGLMGAFVNTLAVNDGVVYAGTRDDGVFRSADQGSNWLKINATPANLPVQVLGFNGTTILAGSFNSGLFSLASNTTNWTKSDRGIIGAAVSALASVGQNLFASAYGKGVYRSTDKGQTWQVVNNGLPPSNSFSNITRLIAVGPMLFALVVDNRTYRYSFYRSENLGESWSAVEAALPSQYLLGSFVVSGDKLLIGTDRGVFRLRDDGRAWVALNTGLIRKESLVVRAFAANGTTFFAGTAKDGVYRSTDDGVTWATANTGLPERDFVEVKALLANGATVFAGVGSDGVYRSTDQGQSWQAVNEGLPQFRNAQALAISGTTLLVGTDRYGLYRSTDQGQSWVVANTGLPNDPLFGPPGIGSLSVIGTTLFAGTDSGIYRSTNQGQSWEAANTGLTDKQFVEAASIIATETNFFVGTSDGIFRSNDDGQTWSLVYDISRHISAFASTGTTLFAGSFGRVDRTTDQGRNWVTASGTSLPNTYINSLAVSGPSLLAATEGLYRSDDSGDNWSRVRGGWAPDVRFESLAVQGMTLFAGSNGDGIYRSLDSGQTWTRSNAGLPEDPLVSSLLITQTAIFAVIDTFFEVHVYRSTDNGQSWTRASAGLPIGFFGTISSLVAGGTAIFAVTRDGVYRSADNGQLWAKANSGFPSGSSLAALGARGATLVAGTQNDGVFRSTNNGEEWNRVNSGLTVRFFPTLPIDSLAANGSSLFAGTSAGIFRSSDNSQSWMAINSGLPKNFSATSLATRGTTLFAGSASQGVYRSSDNGQSWAVISTGLPLDSGVLTIGSNGGTILFGLPGTLDGTGQGTYRSADNGQSFTPVELAKPGQPLTVRLLAAMGTTLFAYTNLGLYRSLDQGANWIAVNASLSDIDFLTVSGTTLYAATFNTVYRSTDQGQSWTEVKAGLPQDPPTTLLAHFVIESLVANAGNLYAGTRKGIYRLPEGGLTWVPLNTSLTNLLVITLIASDEDLVAGTNGSSTFRLTNNVQSWTESEVGLTSKFINDVVVSNNDLFVGTFGSGVFRSANPDHGWAPANNGLPPNANIHSIITNGATLWAATFGDGVYRSTNQGATWTAVNAGLNNKAVNRLFVNGTTLYAGTEGGVYRSTNNGDSWTLISSGMGLLPVDSFAALGGTVYAGTDGNGVFRLNSDGVSWTPKSSGLTSQQVRSLGVNGNVLYAGTIGGGICLSRDGGETWTAINNQLPPTLNVYAFAVSGKKVYAGSIYGVFLTEDEGQTWKQINAGLLNIYVTGLAVNGEQLFASTASGGVFSSRIP